MTDFEPHFMDLGDDGDQRRIAILNDAGGAPGLFWLSGFKSDMVSTKASALSSWARAHGLACTRFDYSGHGQSGGRFEDGTIGRWLGEAEAVFLTHTSCPQIVVGSSMGGYLALLLLRRLMERHPSDAARVTALVLIAPAWDMTEELMWKEMPPAARADLATKGVWLRPSAYGDPYPITRQLIEDGRDHLFARRPWNPGRPVHIIHGLLDPDVPWQHTLDLVNFLDGDHAKVSAVPDGEHRLSRPEDLSLIFDIIGGLVETAHRGH
jgi:pimeloyl-ACP methyl ester carboxylesterase